MNCAAKKNGAGKSRYARKCDGREHVPFQFVEGSSEPRLLGLTVEPIVARIVERPPAPPEVTHEEVMATVKDVLMDREYAFLVTEDQRTIYLSFSVLRRRHAEHELQAGDVIACRIRDRHDGMRPQVTRIRSIERP